jgi:hypothetical protein
MDLDVGVGRWYFATADIASSNNHHPSILRLTSIVSYLISDPFESPRFETAKAISGGLTIKCLTGLRHNGRTIPKFEHPNSPPTKDFPPVVTHAQGKSRAFIPAPSLAKVARPDGAL